MSIRSSKGFETMSSAMFQAKHYHAWIYSLLCPYLGKNILECGTGTGTLTRKLLSSDAEQIYSIDISSSCLGELSDIPDPRLRLEIHDLDSDSICSAFSGRQLDTIISINVLEHIEDDGACLHRLASLLEPGGKILLFVPAFMILYGNMDQEAGHYRRYSKRRLQDLLEESGVSVLQCNYCNPIGFWGWFFANRIGKGKGLNSSSVNAQILFFDRWLLAASRAMTPFTKNLFGQSIFAVARKEDAA